MNKRIYFGLPWIFAACAVVSSADDVTELEELAMKAAVQRVAPAVVRIETFGGQQRVGDFVVSEAPTSGLAVGADGYVVSSAFNFIQKPSAILVTLPSGKRATAQIVSHDHSAMLVLLRVETTEPLVVPQAVERDEMQVGQWTLAVGRTYQSDRPSVSVGILSAKNRIWGKAIQTDAKISPRNYGGPLIDITGRVMGILVPLSPHGQSEVAGAEWYDSGIGFAIPLSDIYGRLERMKEGDLQPGLLGIAVKGSDYAPQIEVAACRAKSPAYEAGLRSGDRIVAVDETPIQRPAQLKHALGTKYAGDKMQLVAVRKGERIEANVELVEKLEEYAHPFLGVLPRRDPKPENTDLESTGVLVRHVYEDSGAAIAGVQPSDRIASFGGEEVADAAALRLAIANREPGTEVNLVVVRDGQQEELTAKLGNLPTAVPSALPPPRDSFDQEVEPQLEVGVLDVKIPEQPNDCFAYIPQQYDPRIPYGVVLYLVAPGSANRDKLVAQWRPECDRRDLILLAPQPLNPTRWRATEIEFIRKALDQITDLYHIDRTRVIVCGDQAGGTLAYLTAYRQRDIVRGVVALDAAMPRRPQPPHNDPVQRLAFYIAVAEKSALAKRIGHDVELLRTLKYPVTLKGLGDTPRSLNADDIAELTRWIDTLDRL